MIKGIGVDLIEVDRVAAKIEKEQGFRELVFSSREIAYCESKTHKFEHYAARFAAKEALLKALGSGWTSGTRFDEIETLPDGDGCPVMALTGETQKTMNAAGDLKIFVSLSHLRGLATAFVILEA